MSDLLAEAGALQPETVRVRRLLHARPELGLDNPYAAGVVADTLADLGLSPVVGSAATSVVATVDGERPGPTTLLRADMDALPLTEDTGLEFTSTVAGVMHACGHDAHVAMLLGAARLLVARRDELAGRVVLMFQPGEEGYGGAAVMLAEGLLERFGPVDRAFALHVTPSLPSGCVATRPGTLLASSDGFGFTVHGRGGHASMPHSALDPVPVACEIVTALQTFVTRRVPVFEPVVLTVASIEAGTTYNVIPSTATVRGTLRAVSEGSRAVGLAGLRRVAEHVAAAHECTVTFAEQAGSSYPVTVNDEGAVGHCAAVATGLLGEQRVISMPHPGMGSEDFSFVLAQVPGAMAFLGAAPSGVERPEPNHSDRMVIDEEALPTGVALLAALALG